MADGPLDGADGVVGIEVKIDGALIQDDVMVQSIRVTHDLGRIPEAVVTIQSGGAEIEDFGELEDAKFGVGGTISVAGFYDAGTPDVLFEGVIASTRMRLDMTRGQTLELICRDKAMALTQARGSAQFLKKKDSDVMTAIVSDAGLSADIEATKEQLDQVRVGVTDWDFLRLLADRNGMVLNVSKGKVAVKVPDPAAAAVLTISLGQDMLGYDMQIDAQRMLAKATYAAWDSATQAVVEGLGKDPADPKLGNATAKDLSKVFGSREITDFIGAEAPLSQLQELASARLLRAALDAVHGTVSYPGCAKAVPGDVIEIKGASKRFSGDGYVSGVRHEISNGTWSTTARLGLPLDWVTDGPMAGGTAAAAGRAATPVPGLQIGTVVKLTEDPDGKLRIQVKLPLLSGDQDTIVWARFATPYAGAGVGVQFLPEIGDEVILGHCANDPGAPVILGAVHNPKAVRPTEATEENFIKQIVTKSELKITFDDDKKSLTLETPGGHKVTLDDDATVIELEDSSGNKITMDDGGITLDTPGDLTLKATGKVDITAGQDATVKGMNVTCEGDMGFTGKGGAQAELNGGGQTTVKGAMVMIN
jgi:Rhs element Vgr protein